MTRIRGIVKIVATSLLVTTLSGSLPALGQAASAPPSAEEKPQSGNGKSPDDWRYAATLYGWATNLSGSATARGNTVNINASIIDLLQKSNSLLGSDG